jgi:hypothetical protein
MFTQKSKKPQMWSRKVPPKERKKERKKGEKKRN